MHKSLTTVGKWSSRWHWLERIKVWNDDEASRKRLAEEEAGRAHAALWQARQQEHRENEFRVGQALLKKAEQMLAFPLAEVTTKDKGKTTIVKPTNWSHRDAARMTDVGSELIRKATNMPTQKIEHTGPEGGPVQTTVGQVIIVIPDNGRGQATPPIDK